MTMSYYSKPISFAAFGFCARISNNVLLTLFGFVVHSSYDVSTYLLVVEISS